MDLMKKRWLILFVSCLVNLCIGSLYSWSVFAGPMADYISSQTGQTVTNLSFVFTIANAVGPLTMISGGLVNDRFGPKWVLLAGALLFGGGMIGASFAKSIWALILTYSLGVGLGMGLVYGTTVSNTIKFFPDKKGLVGGLTTACYGGSSILMPPFANFLIQHFHVTTAFQVIGFLALLVITGASFVLAPCPSDFAARIGYRTTQVSAAPELDHRQMLRTAAFPIMLLILLCGAFPGLMFISQASQITQTLQYVSVTSAALAVSLLALFNTLGRVGAGWLSDSIGILNTLKGTFVCSLAAEGILLGWSDQPSLFYLSLALIGLCFGAIMGLFPAFTASRFGTKHNSVNYGIMFIGFALAGLLGPITMTWLYQCFDNYHPAFLVCCLLSLLGLLLALAFSFMTKKRPAQIIDEQRHS